MSANTASTSQQTSCTIIEVQPEPRQEEPRGAHASTSSASVGNEIRILRGRPANQPPVPRHASAPRRFWLGMQGIGYGLGRADRAFAALAGALIAAIAIAAALL